MEYAQNDPEITRWYYFTGGTALSYCYLHHRYSEDLDFFTRSQVNDLKIDAFFDEIKKPLGITHIAKKQISGLFIYTLSFADGTTLNVDFNEYDFPQVERSSVRLGNLSVDSLFDIAVNKLYTVLSRTRARDFVDLYCCVQQIDCTIDMLFSRLQDKFPVSFELDTVIRQFTIVADLTDYPTMLVPFDREKMQRFFLAEAKKRGKNIFRS